MIATAGIHRQSVLMLSSPLAIFPKMVDGFSIWMRAAKLHASKLSFTFKN
jgi:hypothetical protein